MRIVVCRCRRLFINNVADNCRVPSPANFATNCRRRSCLHLTRKHMITFRASRRRREMYCGHARLCVCVSVCVSAAAWLRYCTDPDVTWGSGVGCPLVVHYWADLQSVHGLRCHGNIRNAWQSLAVIRQAHRTHYACRRRLPSPAIKSTRLLRAPFHFVHTAGCCSANAKC